MWKKLRNIQFDRVDSIALGFLGVILLGTLLLSLPMAVKSRTSVPLVDALFTASSATCVTGLVVMDTASSWSLFGQLVILGLIQIGGLGIITIRVFVISLLNRKIGLFQRNLIQDSVNSTSLSGGVRLVRAIIRRTLLFEGAGALLLSIPFVRDFGWKGIYYGIFHSISAFCNAGFDIFGDVTPGGSLTYYRDNWYVLGIIMALIIAGGLGFVVWEDMKAHKYRLNRCMFQTRVVLLVSAVLIFGGAAVLFVCDYRYLMDLPLSGRFLVPLFQAVTCRTAGFNTVPLAELSTCGRLVMTALMFIGGSPGSTAGGIKTTTFLIMCAYTASVVRGGKDTVFLNRRFDEETIRKAFAVFMIDFTLAVIGVFLMLFLQQSLQPEAVIFETVSAIGTVGLSVGITGTLNTMNRIVVALLMYSGRLGSLTFALMLSRKREQAVTKLAAERIAIG